MFPGLRTSIVPVLAMMAVPLAACDKTDIGAPCPELLEGTAYEQDGARLVTDEVVGVDVSFPCDEFICVATGGRDGYCSKKCRSDASCPDGFVCRTVQETGPFAAEQFCVWRECERRSDCGDREDFCCVTAPSVETQEEFKLCTFSDNGHC